MKKAIILYLMLPLLMFSCASKKGSTSTANYDVAIDPSTDGVIYPSLVLFMQMSPDLDADDYIEVACDKVGEKLRITVEENEFMEKSITEKTVAADDEGVVSPNIKWKRDALLGADQPGYINLTVVVESNGEEVKRFNSKVSYRSVNECVLYAGIDQTEGDEESEATEASAEEEEGDDLSALTACYVNEDNPRIDKILSEILAVDRSRAFSGVQSESDDDMGEQLYWIWEYFSKKGTRYSDISASSNSNKTLVTQYIRFFDQCLDNNQANCIDGTCMLASIMRKIGFDVSIILIPGHAFLGVASAEDSEQMYYIETTMMGTEGDPEAVFQAALEAGQQNVDETDENDITIINIEECRKAGILPLPKSK